MAIKDTGFHIPPRTGLRAVRLDKHTKKKKKKSVLFKT